jgi:hypothetical protein
MGRTRLKLTEKLYELLKDGKEHSSSELALDVSHRFGDTIHKLRREGVKIETRKDESGMFWYRLEDTEGGQAHQPSLFQDEEIIPTGNPRRKAVARLNKSLDLLGEVEGSYLAQKGGIRFEWLRTHLADVRVEIEKAIKVLRG